MVRKIKKSNKVNKYVVKKLRHEELADVLFNKKVVRHNMKRVQTKLHITGTYDVSKISLSCFDDKRYILDDGISTLGYFHKRGELHWVKLIKSMKSIKVNKIKLIKNLVYEHNFLFL